MAQTRKAGTASKSVSKVEDVDMVQAPVDSEPVLSSSNADEAVSELKVDDVAHVEEELPVDDAIDVVADDDAGAVDDENLEDIVESLEENPALLQRFKILLGLGDKNNPDQLVDVAVLSDEASGLPVNTLVLVEWTKEKAAKHMGFDSKEVMAFNVRGGVANDQGDADERIFLVIVTRDGQKHAAIIS